MTDLLHEEFAALRATIRERGTARVWIFFATIAVWAALGVAMMLVGTAPVFTLLPLVVLAAGFEAIFHLHVGVERVGRYLQAFTEDAAAGGRPQWRVLDSNQRRHKPAGLQPAPFGRSGNSPKFRKQRRPTCYGRLWS